MLVGFKERFADLVESGKKRQTIRAPRKDGRVPKVGERVYLYTALRTQAARKLGEGVVQSVHTLRLERRPGDGRPIFADFDGGYIGLRYKDPDRFERDIATRDGFSSPREMLDWFKHNHSLPFDGTVIRWRLLPRSEWREAKGVE